MSNLIFYFSISNNCAQLKFTRIDFNLVGQQRLIKYFLTDQLLNHTIKFIVDNNEISNYHIDNGVNYEINIQNGNSIVIEIYDKHKKELYYNVKFTITDNDRKFLL